MLYSLALILIIFSHLIISCRNENKTKDISLNTEKWMHQKIAAGKVSENIDEELLLKSYKGKMIFSIK